MASWHAKLDKALNEKNAFTDVLAKIEKKTDISRKHLVAGAAIDVIAIFLIFCNIFPTFLSSILGIIYPAYASFRAIEGFNIFAKKDEYTQWLTYWTIYSVFSLMDIFAADVILPWVPSYYIIKLLLLGWCMAPTPSNGSQLLYSYVIQPLLSKSKKKGSKGLNQVGQTITEVKDKAKQKADEMLHQD